MSDDLRVAQPRHELVAPFADDDAVVLSEREAVVDDRETHPSGHVEWQLTFAPRNGCPRDDPLERRHGFVEVVDAVQQVAKLEAPEHLAQLGAVGRREYELRRIAVDVEVAAHRRELLGEPRLVGELDHVLPTRR